MNIEYIHCYNISLKLTKKLFSHVVNFRRHERRHTENTKTIKCTLCKSAFEHKFFLKQHMQRKHGVEIPHEHPQPPPSSVQ